MISKPLLVLDLDESLIYAALEHEASGIPVAPDAETWFDGLINRRYLLYHRPGLQRFLRKMAEHYRLAIWTTATADYAEWVVGTLEDHKFEFVWSKDNCTERAYNTTMTAWDTQDYRRLGTYLTKRLA